MSKARNLADLLDSNGDVVSGALDNGGKILQVVSNSFARVQNSSSSSWVPVTAEELTITPRSASSKILAVFQADVHANNNGTGGAEMLGFFTIQRNGTNLGHVDKGMRWMRFKDYDGNGTYSEYPMTIFCVDSPNTTQAVTYTPAFRTSTGVSIGWQYDYQVRHHYLMEIAG